LAGGWPRTSACHDIPHFGTNLVTFKDIKVLKHLIQWMTTKEQVPAHHHIPFWTGQAQGPKQAWELGCTKPPEGKVLSISPHG